MIKLLLATILIGITTTARLPEVKVAGALKNIMMDGDLSAHINLDTLDKSHLYGLGPVAGLKGEIIILDGKTYSSFKQGKEVTNQQNKVSLAAMLVYSKVESWKEFRIHETIQNYAALEELVKETAQKNGYDVDKPFAFQIKTASVKTTFHVIDWHQGTKHTMDNHKQFAYAGKLVNKPVQLLGFYSTRHKSIFTHHTTNMHVHVLDKKTGTVGHLDDIQIKGSVLIYLPQE